MHNLATQYESFPNYYPKDEQSLVLECLGEWGIQQGNYFLAYPFFCNLRQVQSSWFMILLLECLIKKIVDALIIFYPLLDDLSLFILIGKFVK